MKKFIKIAAVSVFVFGVCTLAYDRFTDAISLVSAENECIAQLISEGVERSDISTSNGKCHIGY